MPEPITIGLLGIAGSLLGSLNRAKPKDDFEAVKIIDENDPIRLSLLAMVNKEPSDVELVLNDGTTVGLISVLEIGYGAARLKIWWPQAKTVRVFKHDNSMTDTTIPGRCMGFATFRYAAIAAVRQTIPWENPQ